MWIVWFGCKAAFPVGFTLMCNTLQKVCFKAAFLHQNQLYIDCINSWRATIELKASVVESMFLLSIVFISWLPTFRKLIRLLMKILKNKNCFTFVKRHNHVAGEKKSWKYWLRVASHGVRVLHTCSNKIVSSTSSKNRWQKGNFSKNRVVTVAHALIFTFIKRGKNFRRNLNLKSKKIKNKKLQFPATKRAQKSCVKTNNLQCKWVKMMGGFFFFFCI